MTTGCVTEKSPFYQPELHGRTELAPRPRAGGPSFLIADDHRFVCEALAHVIGQHWPSAQVLLADGFGAALAQLAASQVDLAVLDFCMPDGSGGEAVEKIRALHPAVKLVIFSGAIEPRAALKALAQGVAAYVPKSIATDSIVHVLTLVLEGETYVPRPLVEAMARGNCNEGGLPRADGLSERDSTLLNALEKGHPNKVIAHSMGVSESTVKLYLHRLFRTLGVHNRTEAVAQLHRLKLIDEPWSHKAARRGD
jgi:DNA-binding NarL/FixJ family response regulator